MKHFIIKNKKLLELGSELKGYFRAKVTLNNEEHFLYFKKVPVWSKLIDQFQLGLFPRDFDVLKKLSDGKTSLLINGYKIRYNPLFNEFQTSHDNIGRCESFSFFDEAEQYCLRG